MSNTITVQFGGSLDLNLHLSPPPPEIECLVTARFGGFIVTAKGYRMAYTLPNDRQVEVQVSYVDAAGNPAVVDGPVAWASSNDAIATVDGDASDSTLALIVGVGPLGTAQITATADADLGTGVRTLITTLDVTVVAGEAVAGTISPVGEAQPKP